MLLVNAGMTAFCVRTDGHVESVGIPATKASKRRWQAFRPRHERRERAPFEALTLDRHDRVFLDALEKLINVTEHGE
jgi:hypothetical protein